ncbi:DNA repair protein rad50 [Bimuria novae-zelandiae CBS 107.79]|uniref:DNA repair protein RAD50 n=1 Tax=Bimuria novae-zelandiae CBS 107.79 TaxID=1447943 RepID=A0A6A5V909_9PLEO|nr:DNA repair protein rad50 [Bimuria novae-zelandiae CBS 107.79]
MSKIDRMQIQGRSIRSFGPKQGETIIFNTPLTLIVGWNGSGKTTIIECLKYATTGELPPNSKSGGAFIHDPKLLSETEVMAMVKLSFRSTSGIPMVVSRKMQLTVKKNTRSQKTLEGSLLMRRDGHKESVSSRVAELDQIVPQFLGVSKAILENVIFCHQEDSLWPMSEPAPLKKKFDAIFEADKYTKAIDSIKLIRKEHMSKLAVHREAEKHAKINQVRAKEAEEKINKLYDQIEKEGTGLRAQHEAAQAQANEARDKAREAYDHAAKFEQVVAQLRGKRVTYQANQENTDRELEEMQDQYEERYRGLQTDLQRNRSALGTKQSELGKHEAEKDQHNRNLQKRETLVQETAKRHSVRGFDHDVDDTQLSRDQNKTLERTRTEAQEELAQAQTVVNNLSEQKTSLNQRKDLSKSQITANDKRITELHNAMSKIRATEKELEKANAEADEADFDNRIQDAENTVHALEEKKERLDTELIEATQLASESAEMDYTQNKLKETKHSLETMKSVHSARIAQLIDSDWDVAALDSAFRDVLAQKTNDLKDAESKREISQDKLNQISFKLSSVESEQKKKRVEYAKYKDTFEDKLQELEESYGIMSSDQAKMGATLEYFEQCLEIAEKHNECRLCKRTLKDEKDFTKAKFMANLKNLIARASQNVEEDLEQVTLDLEKARNVKPSYELAKRAEDVELPALKAQYDKLISERNTVNQQLEQHDALIYELNQAKQEVESLSTDVQSIVSSYNAARELEDRIIGLKKKQKSGGLSRGINAVREDLQKVTDEGRRAKGALAALVSERDKLRKLVGTLELRIRDVNAELSAAQSSLKEKRSLAERMEELKIDNTKQRDDIRRFDAHAKHKDVNRRGNERVNRVQEEASKLSDSVRQLADADQDISAYIHKDIQRLQNDIERIEQEMSDVARDVKQTEEVLSGVEHTKQSIFDNLRYRKARRTLKILEEEIKQLEKQDAEKDQAHWNAEAEEWDAKYQLLHVQLDVQMDELNQEYIKHYKNAALKYREAHINVETTKAACEDLARYGSALEQAILKFHSLKMEEINKIIDELWRNAYQGTDVDTVRIRSDNEGGARNRTYNYRVVMVKRDNEMDMRGRCSAGQKVLASIVIRLALAECFGTNCGLIALDEPTTNLDQQNIKGLAESISQIIQIRRKQANFQLLVITHDEQFLREMNCSDFTDVYWRVGRDKDQQSYIERQNISEVNALLPPFMLPISRTEIRNRAVWPDYLPA